MTNVCRLFLALVFTCLAALAHAAQVDPPTRAGRLNYLSGPVSLAPADTPDDWAYATLNRPLTTGDRLWADQNGRAELHVGSTAVRVSSQTSLDILNLDDHTLQLRLAQGDVNLRVRAIDRDETIEVDTPSGAVLLEQPGSYRIDADPSGDSTVVTVHSGRAQVLTNTTSVPVNSNQQVRFSGADGVPSQATTAPPGDEFDRWSAERDRHEDRIAATRYVSPDMTGYEDLDAYGTWRAEPEYGTVWVPTTVVAGWAPYRYGHWVWIEPWGWTWVDDAPWGFAPFHYGRWIWLNGYWAWAPGTLVARPVYAPALVAFVGGSNWSVSIGGGPAVGWFPLGWREPYVPWYRTSPTYVRNVNITHVRNINVYNMNNNVTRINYVNQRVPQAVTVVSKDIFVSAKPVERAVLKIPPARIATAPVLRSTVPAQPAKTSFIPERSGARPPAAASTREVVAMRAPPARTERRFAEARSGAVQRSQEQRAAPAAAEPRVRVIGPRRAEAVAPEPQPPTGATRGAAPRAATPNNVPRPPQARLEERQERAVPRPPVEARPHPAPQREPRVERAPARPTLPAPVPQERVQPKFAPARPETFQPRRPESPPRPPNHEAAPRPSPRIEVKPAPPPPQVQVPRPEARKPAEHGPARGGGRDSRDNPKPD